MYVPTITLNDGNKIPAIGFGTGSALKGKDATPYVDQALEAGFDHIDTAAVYETETSVAESIRHAGLNRSDLWITTKYDGGDIQQAIRESLAKLELKSVDLYLIHLARIVPGGDIVAAWEEFEKIKKDGLAKSIGVSNFSLAELKTVVESGSIKPSVNQIQLHAYNYAVYKGLFEYCAKHNIVIEAYGSLAPITRFPGGPVDDALKSISKRIGGTPAQVIFKWLLAKGIVVVTQSTKEHRVKEYLATVDLPDLTEEEIAAIEEAGAKGPPVLGVRFILCGLLLQFIVLCLFLYTFVLYTHPGGLRRSIEPESYGHICQVAFENFG